MNKEKIIAYLNLDKDKKIDKSIMKISYCFDFGFTLFIIICGLTFKVYSFSASSLIYFSLFLLCDVAFYIWYKKLKNPAYEFPFLLTVLSITILKLLFAFLTFSIARQNNISMIHILILLICVFLAVWVIRGKYLLWCDLNYYTLEQAKKKAQSRKSNKPIIPISATSAISVVIFLFLRKTPLKISIELCFWGLACIWLIMAIICTYNCYFVKKYNVIAMFKENNQGNNQETDL